MVLTLAAARTGQPHASRSFAVVFVLLFAFGLGSLSWVDAASAAVLRGTVVDPQGNTVAAVRVDVVGPLGARHVYTDASGGFTVADLPAGAYRVLADAEGFSADAQSLTVSEADDRTLTIALAVGRVSESVVVSAAQVEVAESDAPASVHVVRMKALLGR